MRLALFSVSFAGLWGQDRLTLEDSIDLTAELGFDGIEIMGKRPHLSPLDYSVDDCRRLRDEIERRGLSVAAIAGYTDFGANPRAPEVPLGEMQLRYVQDLVSRAAALECRLVRVFSAYEIEGTSFMAQWRRTVDALRACCDLAVAAGVHIGLQNHHDLGVDTKAYLELLADVDRPGIRVGVTLGSSSQAALSREFRNAVLVPAPDVKGAIEMLSQRRVDAYATNKAILFEMSDALPGSRVLDGRWGLEHLAIAVPKGRDAGMAWLRGFAEDAQREGMVTRAADRAGLRGLAVPR